MTNEELDRLPILLRPGQAAEVIGCTRATLLILAREHPALAFKLPGMKEWRYRKNEIIALIRTGQPREASS